MIQTAQYRIMITSNGGGRNDVYVLFIRPFEKRTYYAVAMSIRPSVRLSIRPSFPDFFSTCFDSLQPKVGQTQFLQTWTYKSR